MIAALIVVPVYMLFIRDDPEQSPPSQAALIEAATDPARAGAVLTQRIGDHEQGVELRYPNDWRGQLDQGNVRVTSPDQSTTISVSAQGTAPQAKSLFRAAIEGVSGDFKDANVIYTKDPPPIAGSPSAQAVVKGTQAGAQRSALVAVVRGKRRSWVVSVIAPATGGEVGVANVILVRGLTLTG